MTERHDHSMAAIQWDGENPSPEVIAKVRDSIRDELDGLLKPGDLIFHVVLLSDDETGPTVTLWGEDGHEAFHAEYRATTEWVPLSDFDPEDHI